MLTDITKDTFDTLKIKFINVSLLAHFNFNKQIHIESDALNTVVIIIILQLINNELWYFIVYWSCKIQKSEMQYDTHNYKLFIIIVTFKHWRHYFKDLTHLVKVLFDYVNFKFFIIIKHLNQH